MAWYNLGGYLTEDCVNAFFRPVQFLFNFATPKFVVIKDWRLGLILRLLQVAILIYVLYDIISKASYLIQEVPKGVITPFAAVTGGVRRQSLRDQRDRFDEGNLQYCSEPESYAYSWNNATYENFSCVMMDALAVPIPGESRFFVTTNLRLDKLYFVATPEGTTCNAAQPDTIPSDAERLGNYYGVCLYSAIEDYFPITPEEVPLEILHSYYTSVVDKSGSLPKTVITTPGYSDGGELNFEKGENIRFTMSDLLKVAGVDLDSTLDNQPNEEPVADVARGEIPDSTEEAYPKARVSGVTIIMNFKYYVRRLAPGSHRQSVGPDAGDVICIVELEPQYVWTSQGSDIQQRLSGADDPFFVDPSRERTTSSPSLEGVQVDYQRRGVQLSFQVSGNMGTFDFFALVDALVAGAVLLSVAQLIVTYVALYALGLSSTLYMEFMRESVNWRKEYARFAAQSLVAGASFDDYDNNNSGSLDRPEIYRYLQKVFGEALDDVQTACLADFLMRQGEQDVTVSTGRLEEARDVVISTISATEWVDIFTEEKVKVSSLKRLIDNEYRNEDVKTVLLNLAEGRYVRGLSTAVSGAIAVDVEGQAGEAGQSLLTPSGVSKTKEGSQKGEPSDGGKDGGKQT